METTVKQPHTYTLRRSDLARGWLFDDKTAAIATATMWSEAVPGHEYTLRRAADGGVVAVIRAGKVYRGGEAAKCGSR